MAVDIEALKAAAEKALAEHPGARACETYPYQQHTEAFLLNDEGEEIAEGDKAQIELSVAAQPRVILALLAERERMRRVVEAATAYYDSRTIMVRETWPRLLAALAALEDAPDA